MSIFKLEEEKNQQTSILQYEEQSLKRIKKIKKADISVTSSNVPIYT